MEALKKMKNNKVVGIEYLLKHGKLLVQKKYFSGITKFHFKTETISEEWRLSSLIPVFKNKGDIQESSNDRESKLMSHNMKLRKRVIERWIREEVTYSYLQFGFMPVRSTTDTAFALHQLIKKYRE